MKKPINTTPVQEIKNFSHLQIVNGSTQSEQRTATVNVNTSCDIFISPYGVYLLQDSVLAHLDRLSRMETTDGKKTTTVDIAIMQLVMKLNHANSQFHDSYYRSKISEALETSSLAPLRCIHNVLLVNEDNNCRFSVSREELEMLLTVSQDMVNSMRDKINNFDLDSSINANEGLREIMQDTFIMQDIVLNLSLWLERSIIALN